MVALQLVMRSLIHPVFAFRILLPCRSVGPGRLGGRPRRSRHRCSCLLGGRGAPALLRLQLRRLVVRRDAHDAVRAEEPDDEVDAAALGGGLRRVVLPAEVQDRLARRELGEVDARGGLRLRLRIDEAHAAEGERAALEAALAQVDVECGDGGVGVLREDAGEGVGMRARVWAGVWDAGEGVGRSRRRAKGGGQGEDARVRVRARCGVGLAAAVWSLLTCASETSSPGL